MSGAPSAAPGSAATICLADDEQMLRNVTAAVLRRHGYDVVTAPDTAGVQASVEQGRVDLVVADIHMPGNAQLELLEWEPVRSSSLPVILMTGRPSVASAVQALRLSAIDYLTKPFEPNELVARVQRGLALAAQRRAVRVDAERAQQVERLLADLRRTLLEAGPPPPPAVPGKAGCGWKLPPREYASLTPREREIITQLVASGAVHDVAGRLGISRHTVRNHLQAIYKKLQVNSQLELLRKVMAGSAA
ncbi:MAG: response regulator [Myxococcales bacterium FL481]|nr:MAG: response regulator [Myxococcales bacterium FL481]